MSNNQLHAKIESLIYEGRLKQALNELSSVINSDTDWTLYTRLSETATAYNYMLEYMRKGMPDPNREALHRELSGRSLTINDEFRLLQQTSQGVPTTFALKRSIYRGDLSAESLRIRLSENCANLKTARKAPLPQRREIEQQLLQQHENILKEAFYRLLTNTGSAKQTHKEILTLLTDKEIPTNDRATLTSAVTLGLLQCFEPGKVLLLCKLSTDEETIIAVRALIGVIIILSTHSKRLKYHPEILSALETLRDTTTIMRRIGTIQIQLLRCRETQKIDRKMREEIIPAMMKNPHLGGEKLGMDIIKEMDEDEHNPEWKAWIEKDEIKEKLDEMAKWQIEGADVYMSTFSQLKRYPFFSEMSNWLRPFDTNVPEISQLIPDGPGTRKTLLTAICSSRFFCNSDKYSFCFTFNQVPQQQRDMLMQQIPESADDIPETIAKAPKEQDSETIGNQYIQDLYRFFRLSHYGKEFTDPFGLSLNLLNDPILAPLIDDKTSMLHIFHYLVEKGYYTEAIGTGETLEKRGTESVCDAQFYQKLGYCLQKTGNYRKAIEQYTKADILLADSLWTMRHIAQCYRLIGEYENALHYYIAAEEVAPDNLTLLLQTGECLAVLKRYDEAFARFFKVEYLDSNSLRSWRAIAWCSFLTGKDEQARHYYKQLLQNSGARLEDYINAAHVEWITGNRPQAIELYNKALEISGNKEKFEQLINQDKEVLIERGASPFELTLLNDLLQ